jgi:TPR repeat protein
VAAKLAERACHLGDPPSCAGVVTWGGGPHPIPGLTGAALVAAQWKMAADTLDPFCRRGEAGSCLALGKLRREMDERSSPKPIGWDPMLALRYLDHACTMGNGEGCYELGVARLHLAHFEGDLRDAKAALQRACFMSFGRGCVALSQLTPDRQEAQRLVDLGCRYGGRGYRGSIYTNYGLPELEQPLNCGPGSRR